MHGHRLAVVRPPWPWNPVPHMLLLAIRPQDGRTTHGAHVDPRTIRGMAEHKFWDWVSSTWVDAASSWWSRNNDRGTSTPEPVTAGTATWHSHAGGHDAAAGTSNTVWSSHSWTSHGSGWSHDGLAAEPVPSELVWPVQWRREPPQIPYSDESFWEGRCWYCFEKAEHNRENCAEYKADLLDLQEEHRRRADEMRRGEIRRPNAEALKKA